MFYLGIIYTCFFNAKSFCCSTDPCCQSGVDLTVLMEQFLDGPEVDVDVTCFARGRMDEGVEGDVIC